MTWDQLIGKIREGLAESGAHLRVLGSLLADVSDNDRLLTHDQIDVVVVGLALAMSDLHSVIEHTVIGLDAMVGAHRDADKSQEVKGDGAKST